MHVFPPLSGESSCFGVSWILHAYIMYVYNLSVVILCASFVCRVLNFSALSTLTCMKCGGVVYALPPMFVNQASNIYCWSCMYAHPPLPIVGSDGGYNGSCLSALNSRGGARCVLRNFKQEILYSVSSALYNFIRRLLGALLRH